MSQLSLNYRNSPLSELHGFSGGIKAGDRIPNVKLMTIGGDGEASDKPQPKSIFQTLDIDAFTLLLANATDSEQTRQSVHSSLNAWKKMVRVCRVAAAPGREEMFQHAFGKHPSMILVRPDGYAAFTGSEDSLEALTKYLSTWFPVQRQPLLKSQ